MGFSSWICPICDMPILNSTSIGTVLCHVALLYPDGSGVFGIYDGYSRIAGFEGEDEIDPTEHINAEDSSPGFCDGEAVIVHQACVPGLVREYIKPGKKFPVQKWDPGQGHSYTDKQVAEFLDALRDLWPDILTDYDSRVGKGNALAKIDSDQYFSENGSRCPACLSSRVQPSETVRYNALDDTLGMICIDCRSTWFAKFSLEGYERLNVSEVARRRD